MEQNRCAALAKLLMDAFLMTALLILVIFGARLYAGMLDAKAANTRKRLPLSFIQSQTAGAVGEIRIAPGPGGDMLCIGQGDYETRIYALDGSLQAEFSPMGSGLTPDNSQSICPVADFTLREEAGLIAVEVDGCVGYVCTGGAGNE